MKKSLSIIIAVVLTVALASITVFSADKKDITINSKKAGNEVSKEIKELVNLISTDIMLFQGSDNKWTGEYRIIQKGEDLKAELSVVRNFGGYEDKTFKYTIETDSGKTTGTIAFQNGGMYDIETSFIPEKDKTIKVMIEWGNEKSVLELTNRITEDVITSEKALEIFKNRFSQVKDLSKLSRIRFHYDFGSKSWHIPFANGGVDIDAITGEVGNPIYAN